LTLPVTIGLCFGVHGVRGGPRYWADGGVVSDTLERGMAKFLSSFTAVNA